MFDLSFRNKNTGERITLQEFAQIVDEIYDFTEALNPDLTPEEIQYLKLVLDGYEPNEIIPEMKLEKNYANKLQDTICKKFKTNDIINAMLYAYLLKIIS